MSRYEFLFHMRRHKRAAFFKIFLPPLFIALVVSNMKKTKFVSAEFVCLFVFRTVGTWNRKKHEGARAHVRYFKTQIIRKEKKGRPVSGK